MLTVVSFYSFFYWKNRVRQGIFFRFLSCFWFYSFKKITSRVWVGNTRMWGAISAFEERWKQAQALTLPVSPYISAPNKDHTLGASVISMSLDEPDCVILISIFPVGALPIWKLCIPLEWRWRPYTFEAFQKYGITRKRNVQTKFLHTTTRSWGWGYG